MSTVLALGHFCEVHGPRLVFYTIRNINEPQFVSQCPDFKFCSGCKAPLLEGYISTVQTVHNTPTQTPSPSTPLACSIQQDPGCSSSKLNNTSDFEQERALTDLHSERASTSRPSSVTRPSGTAKYYCSHSNYDHSHLSHLHSCIGRTLSCELSPNNSVAFTSTNIWVIGTAFSLKDSQARGFHRKYCLIFTFLPDASSATRGCCEEGSSSKQNHHHKHKSGKSKHKSSQHQPHHNVSDFFSDGDVKASDYPSLVPYYEYITEEFYGISKTLQTECEKVFLKEQSVSPQRAIRLNSFLEGTSSSAPPTLGAGAHNSQQGPSRLGGKNFLKSNSGAARSLPQLSSNPHIFLGNNNNSK